ncbi:Cupin [Pandoravirus salinus]|uniref:Cupin n=1 Tax=Pandoravirus salinus TaxID=1349410 RepID=A0A291ATU0_9VIRU|nr:Cupin [Pandoravirus salinus]ATE82303.1 Cupin [Pandoravirus salinus]
MATPKGTDTPGTPHTATDYTDADDEQEEVDSIIARLGMTQHAEGGYYATVNRVAPEAGSDRAPYSVIYFLLDRKQRSHWHRLDAAEVWFWHKGSPLEMSVSDTGERVDSTHVLGSDLTANQKLQVVVPRGAWQTARPVDGWTLVSCMMVPQFAWSGFTLAPPDWVPGVPI